MGLILCVLQSCSTEELFIESESNRNVRDYSYEEITFLDLKKINNNAFIESAKLKKVIATSKNKDINSASNYDIDLKSIRYIKRKNNDETFSFRIFQVPTATFQQNIVVECKKNEKPQSYLVTYYLNKQVSQINNSDDFIRAIKSTSIIKIEDPLKTHRTTNGGCLQVGYFDDVEVCQDNLDTRPRCYNSDRTRATIKVFKVIDSACSTGGVSDFTPLASQWNQYNTAPADPYSGNTGSTAGGGATGESTGINIFAPNYYENGDLSDPAVQNMLQINQFLTSLYISSNEIKAAVDSTEWLLAYTNYWIGTNGGLTSSNQIALTYAFNNIPMLFNQYNGTSYELNAINNFKFSSFQFLLFHGEFLSKLDPLTQKSILAEITSLEKIELMNNVVNFMTENPNATWEQIENWFMGISEGQDGEYDADFWEDPNLTFQKQNLPTYNNFVNSFPRDATGILLAGADIVYSFIGGEVGQLRFSDPNHIENTCALKVSRALNYSGVVIPEITKPNGTKLTIKGADNKYYFLNSKALNLWMRKTFGNPTGTNHITAIQAGQHGVNLPNLLTGKKGIYSLISSDTKWAYGHADFLKPDATCEVYCHFYDAPIDYIDVWILN